MCDFFLNYNAISKDIFSEKFMDLEDITSLGT